MHDHIGALTRAVGTLETLLGVILTTRLQSGCLEQAFEHHFTPRALGAIVTLEGTGQVDRILADLLVEFLQRADLLHQHAAFALLVGVGLGDRFAKFLELDLQRIKQAAELLGALLLETLGLGIEDLVGKILEGFAQALLGLVEQGQLLARRLGLLVRTGLQRGVLTGEGEVFAARQFVAGLQINQLSRQCLDFRLALGRLRTEHVDTLFKRGVLGVESFKLAFRLVALALEAIALLAQGRYFGLARGDGVKRRIICPTLAKPGEKQRAEQQPRNECANQDQDGEFGHGSFDCSRMRRRSSQTVVAKGEILLTAAHAQPPCGRGWCRLRSMPRSRPRPAGQATPQSIHVDAETETAPRPHGRGVFGRVTAEPDRNHP